VRSEKNRWHLSNRSPKASNLAKMEFQIADSEHDEEPGVNWSRANKVMNAAFDNLKGQIKASRPVRQ
jgi:hypothetical protein